MLNLKFWQEFQLSGLKEVKFKIKCGGFLLVVYLRVYFITLTTLKAGVDHNDQYETQLSLQKGIVPK